MHKRDMWLLVGILLVVSFTAWVVWPGNPGIHLGDFNRDIKVHRGLDLSGGMQVLLEADVPATQEVTKDAMDAARGIIENRVNGLGVAEPNVQLVGDRHILVELPGVEDPDQAVAAFRSTGLLEFIDVGNTRLEEGTVVSTTFGLTGTGQGTTPAPTASASPTTAQPTATATEATTPTAQPTTVPATEAAPAQTASASPTAAQPTATATEATTPAAGTQPTAAPTAEPTPQVYTTVLTGKDLQEAAVDFDAQNKPVVRFVFKPEAAKTFGDYTTQNVNKFLAIVLDKRVISCPQIDEPITEGDGIIKGQFTLADARSLVLQLKYGALPIPLKVVERRTVGPTLGQDSVNRSVQAGAVGLVIVLLFMLIYYRLPGVLADLALLIYALVTFALFKLIPVTLTLPGVAGFLLSVGMAVDANILIFERMKEELRHGRGLAAAIDAGFDRAWTSIRDSNLSTLITCVILFWFGSNYGASAVKGFAVTLFLGVAVSMFTAITVTRTFMRTLFAFAGERLRGRHQLLGV